VYHGDARASPRLPAEHDTDTGYIDKGQETSLFFYEG
jgi:hypothetical protein